MSDETQTRSFSSAPQPQIQDRSKNEDGLPEVLLHALDSEIEPVRKPFFYFVGLILVAVAMVALPLIYLGLVALVGYGIYYHATENSIIFSGGGGGLKLRILAYVGPLVVGCVVIFFMIKPLFARPPKGPEPFSVDPEKQTLLFHYVHRLSSLLRAPLPKRIDLDCNVNASAGFRRGWLSMMGNDLVLTIGLPLVEGMTIRQLTGVLAHELGHFAQGGGMRLSYVIRSVNHWFARVVYERDEFDISLQESSESGGYWAWQLILVVARGCVWLTRRILWILMNVGHLISCFLLRQMEYDADRYETRLSGSDEFEKTVYRLTMLSVGGQISSRDINQFWEERKLPDLHSSLVASNADLIEEEIRQKIWRDVLSQRTRWLGTHPSNSDRIRSALRENAPGLVQVEAPARSLFEDYPALSRAVTVNLYNNLIEAEDLDEMLVPTADLLGEKNHLAKSFAALERLFQGRVTPVRPVFLPDERIIPPVNHEELIAKIHHTRQSICEPPESDDDPQTDLMRDRLQDSLQLLFSPAAATKLDSTDDDTNTEEVSKKVSFLHGLEPHYAKIVSLNHRSQKLLALLQQFEERKEEEEYAIELRGLASECWSILDNLKVVLRNLSYPYQHSDKECSCENFAIPDMPPKDNLGAIFQASAQCAHCILRLYIRVVADLALAAEKAEAAVGLAPLPDLPPDSSNETETEDE